jgi:hypothetical protein
MQPPPKEAPSNTQMPGHKLKASMHFGSLVKLEDQSCTSPIVLFGVVRTERKTDTVRPESDAFGTLLCAKVHFCYLCWVKAGYLVLTFRRRFLLALRGYRQTLPSAPALPSNLALSRLAASDMPS